MCLSVPAQVTKIIDPDNQIVLVNISGVSREVNVACVIDQNTSIEQLVNKWLLVHVGFALSIIDEQEALKTLRLLDEIGELSTTLDEIKQGEH